MLFKTVNPRSSDEAPHSKVSPASFIEKVWIYGAGSAFRTKTEGGPRHDTTMCQHVCSGPAEQWLEIELTASRRRAATTEYCPRC
jgi:hypothetical protein